MIIENILKILVNIIIIFCGLYIAGIDIVYFIREKEDKHRFIKIIYATVGIYWASLYSAFIVNPDIQYFPSTRYWVRLGVLITLIALSLGATVRAFIARIFRGRSL